MSEVVDNTYTADLARILYQHALNGQFTDFRIRAGSKTVYCHQSVVSAKSEYFHSICTSGMTEAILEHGKEEDEQILKTVLKFLYLGKANITVQNVESLMLAAEFIKHAELKRECEELMIANLTMLNLSRYHTLAKKVGLSTLCDECVRMGRGQFAQVRLSDWYLSMSVDEVEEYLEDDELNVANEDDVIDAIQDWLRHSRATSKGKEDYLDMLLHCIRLPFCTQSKLDAMSKDRSIIDKFRLRIFEYLNHGFYGDCTARKSYADSFRSRPADTPATPGISATSGAFASPGASGAHGMSTVAPKVKPRVQDTTLPAGLSTPPQAVKRDASEKVLVLGGYTNNKIPHTDVIALGDENTESTTITSIPVINFSLCTTEDFLIISGGEKLKSTESTENSVCSVRQFSLSTMTWTDLSDMPAPVSAHGTACVKKRLFTIGGGHVCNNTPTCLSSVNVLDLTSNTWSPCEDIPEALAFSGIAVVEEDILAVGGWNGKFSKKTFKLNTKTLKWTTCSPMPGNVSIVYNSAVSIDQMVYVLPGRGFFQYDVAVDQWNELVPPPKLSFRCALVLTQGKLMALGGYENEYSVPNDYIQTYDVAGKTWKLEKKRMPVPLRAHWAVVVRD